MSALGNSTFYCFVCVSVMHNILPSLLFKLTFDSSILFLPHRLLFIHNALIKIINYIGVIFMLETVEYLSLIIFSVVGIICSCKCFIRFILRNKSDTDVYIIIPIKKNCENAEQLVRSTAERSMLMGKSRWDKIVCVDYGCNNETRKIIKILCREYSFMHYMTFEEFLQIFSSEKSIS